jgi:ABC-type transporter Mla subunit MlaD
MLKQRVTETLRSAEAPTKKLAKDTGHAVGSAAQAAPARLRDRATEALQTAEGPTKKLARDTEQAVGSAAQDGRDAVGTAIRDTGQAVAAAANKAKAPALVGAATLATVGGGIALGSKVKQRRRKRVLGVGVPRRTAVGKAAKRVGKAVDSLSSTGQEIGQWSDDLQYLRQRIAGGNGPLDKATTGGSARSERLQGKSGAGRKVTPRAVARRILC